MTDTLAVLAVAETSAAAEAIADGVGLEATATCVLPAGASAFETGPPVVELARDAGVVVLDSSQPSRDLAGWIAATLDRDVLWRVERVDGRPGGPLRATRLVNGVRIVHELPPRAKAIVLARSAVNPEAPPSHERVPSPRAAVLEVQPRAASTTCERVGAHDPGADLRSSRVLVAVGRGAGGAEGIEIFDRLARRLGAGLGATRVVVDNGWLPFAHQVGQTGVAVAPELYIAFGISGAPQHTAGMADSRRIVAVNTDPDAPLCRIADVVIQADAVETATRLLERLDLSREGSSSA